MASTKAGKTPAIKTTPRQPAASDKKRAGVVAPVKRAGAGRPSSYRPEFAEQARKFCLLGATDKRLAELFEISEVTLNAWKHEYPEFLKSLKEGKELADANVASSLYHRALGYSHAEDDIRALNGEIVITQTIKHYPPDTAAATLWLKNRQGHIWRDKVETALTGADGGPIQYRAVLDFVRPPVRKDES